MHINRVGYSLYMCMDPHVLCLLDLDTVFQKRPFYFLYLANDTRYRHGYYGRRIGNRTQAFEWHQFQ